jgi:hypothetical protein
MRYGWAESDDYGIRYLPGRLKKKPGKEFLPGFIESIVELNRLISVSVLDYCFGPMIGPSPITK